MKHIVKTFCLLALGMLGLWACSDDDGATDEYSDWQARNEAYSASQMATARTAIAAAKQAHGAAWEEHCGWKTFVSFRHDENQPTKAGDSIVVEVLEKGEGRVTPYINDSVRIFYRGRLIPSASYPEGMVFAYSGQSSKYEDIFNVATAVPTTRRAYSFVTGFSTALLHMHTGDRWRIYLPAALGYGKVEQGSIPAYSTLVFEVKLLAFFRSGAVVTPWN